MVNNVLSANPVTLGLKVAGPDDARLLTLWHPPASNAA